MNMFGIPNTLVDVCGDAGDHHSQADLCARWMQLAAYMPFARDYYNGLYFNYTLNKTMDGGSGELYYLDQVNQKICRNALYARLTYSRYIYSELYRAYRYGGSVAKPLFFDYPSDD